MHVNKVLDLLKREKLYVEFPKCEFVKMFLVYFRYVVGDGKLRVDPSKVDFILDCLKPSIVTKVKSLRGSTILEEIYC